VQVTVLNRQRRHRVAARPLVAFVERAGRELPPEEPASLVVCLVSDRRMRELNRHFRHRDGTTDVLSFADGEPVAPGAERHLGDVVISVQTASRQARDRGHSLSRELKLLALHGYLHLLGYDHETDGGRMMRLQGRLERRLLPAGRRRGDP
jgi:probable rRNA maturation factor